jgi:hypothetical protein
MQNPEAEISDHRGLLSLPSGHEAADALAQGRRGMSVR